MGTNMHDHIVKSYDEEQKRLLNETLRMGEMAAAQLEAALDVVQRRDDKAAERIIGNDEAIDALEHEISHDVMKLAPPLPHIAGLHALGTLAVQQVRDSLAAYKDSDIELAQRVRARDAEIDIAYTGLFRELLTYMMEDARSITGCTHLLFMAKNMERVGDHATNIAENVWFLVRGEEPLPPREKRDESTAPRA